MELLGLFGQGIDKSYSPAIHSAALRESGRKGQYMLWPVEEADLHGAMRGAYLLGARGANVTTPHKEAAALLCTRLDPWARRIGAVNVLVRGEGGWIGHNTDADGFWQPIAAVGRPVREALVLGTGGAALAVCAALEREGVRLHVAGRNREKLGRFAIEFRAQTLDWQGWTGLHGLDLIVNATTLGGRPGESPLAEHDIPEGIILYDLLYRPAPTELQQRALRRGCRVLGGNGMLLAQALLAWRLWYGEQPPHRAMAAALDAAMQADAARDKGE
ncbi:MAG: shikimate dehydrogenase [Thermaerobacter sp.]|nr:shikimate dehydrogenase [Thermaerobacter sp.]